MSELDPALDLQWTDPEPNGLPAAPAFHRWLIPGGGLWASFHRLVDGIEVRFPNFCRFEIRDQGRSVVGTPCPDVDEGTLSHLYLNQVLPLALNAQGIPVYHGSAVAQAGHAIAFLGATGHGKSTLATYFATHGATLLTDDCLTLRIDGSGDVLAMPSHPSVRLWADSEAALFGGKSQTHAPTVVYTRKARLLAGDGLPMSDVPMPLRRVYVLAERDGLTDQITIRRLSGAQASAEWIKHSFQADIESKSDMTRQFIHATRLAGTEVMRLLSFPRDFARLPDVAAAILADLDLNS